MAEYFLTELRKRFGRKRIGIFYDGHHSSMDDYDILPRISEKFREYGMIRTALYFCDKAPEKSNIIEEAGFTVKIFPSVYSDLSMCLEVYEKVLFDDYDMVILVTSNSEFLTLLNELRSRTDQTIVITESQNKDLYKNLSDEVIEFNDLDNYVLDEIAEIERQMDVEGRNDLQISYIDQITTPSKIGEQIEELSLSPVSEAFEEKEEE